MPFFGIPICQTCHMELSVKTTFFVSKGIIYFKSAKNLKFINNNRDD